MKKQIKCLPSANLPSNYIGQAIDEQIRWQMFGLKGLTKKEKQARLKEKKRLAKKITMTVKKYEEALEKARDDGKCPCCSDY